MKYHVISRDVAYGGGGGGGGGGERELHSLVRRPNVEVLWRTTNELRVSVLVMDRGGSDVTLDLCSSKLVHARVQY